MFGWSVFFRIFAVIALILAVISLSPALLVSSISLFAVGRLYSSISKILEKQEEVLKAVSPDENVSSTKEVEQE